MTLFEKLHDFHTCNDIINNRKLLNRTYLTVHHCKFEKSTANYFTWMYTYESVLLFTCLQLTFYMKQLILL